MLWNFFWPINFSREHTYLTIFCCMLNPIFKTKCSKEDARKRKGKVGWEWYCGKAPSPTSTNCLTRSLICATESGGLSALMADNSKQG